MTELRQILSTNMKAYRAKLGYSQAKLAELVDTTTNYIAQIENCKRFPSDSMLGKIATALKIKDYMLFSVKQYEKKIEEDWKTQILSDLEQFIHKRLAELKEK